MPFRGTRCNSLSHSLPPSFSFKRLHTYDKVSHVPFLFESPVSAQGSLNTLSHVYIVSRGTCKQTEESLLSVEENVNLAGKKKRLIIEHDQGRVLLSYNKGERDRG